MEYSDEKISPLRWCIRQSTYHARDTSWSSHARCVQLLIEAKADVTEKGLLEECYYHYNHAIVVLLTHSGAKFKEKNFNPLWLILNNSKLSEEQAMEAVQHLVDNNLLEKQHHNFEGMGQNPMCAPRYVPPTSVEYALEERKEPKLAEMLKLL